jgi:hypothetical protein
MSTAGVDVTAVARDQNGSKSKGRNGEAKEPLLKSSNRRSISWRRLAKGVHD